MPAYLVLGWDVVLHGFVIKAVDFSRCILNFAAGNANGGVKLAATTFVQRTSKWPPIHKLTTMQFAGSWKIANGLCTSFPYRFIWREKSGSKISFTEPHTLAKNMQFTGNRKNRRSRINALDSSQDAWTHTHGLQMYKIPPTDNITLEEFEEFATDRLKGTRSCLERL